MSVGVAAAARARRRRRLCAVLALAVLSAAGAGAAAAGEACEWCPACPPPPARCRLLSSGRDEYFYSIDNDTRLQVSFTGQYLKLRCPAGVALDSASLPRLPRAALLARAHLHACAPPAAGYARALAALNVTVLDALELSALPAEPPLRDHHLRGLPALSVLALSGAALLPAALLAPLPALRSLHVAGVLPPARGALAVPASVRLLRASGAGLGALAAGARLARLPELRALMVADPEMRAPPALDAAPALRHVALAAPLLALPPLHHLHNATFSGAQDVTLTGACGELRRLRVERPARAPPPAWLAGCGRLQTLELVSLPAAALPADLLAALPALRELLVQRSALAALPPGLLAPPRALRSLNLAHNLLAHLDGDAFSALTALEELDLSYNMLSARALVPLLAPLAALRTLRLDTNPLGDLCPRSSATLVTHELSALAHLQQLRELSLSNTNATRVCVDWRRDLRELLALDLRSNNITELSGADLQWAERSAGRVELDLGANELRALVLTREDYLAASPRAPATVAVAVSGRVRVRCDCRAYWAARALRDARLRAVFPRALRCDAPAAATLHDVPLDDLVCAVGPEGCAPGCACEWRAADNTTVARCARAGLARLPRLPAGAPLAARTELLTADNRIDTLQPEDLPDHLQVLDLSGNLLTSLDEATLRALFGVPARRVLLARNPLACTCAQRAMLLALQAHAAQLPDFDSMRCAAGTRGPVRGLDAGALCGAGLRGALGGAAAALGAALALAGACYAAARRHARLRLKAFLLARGLCLRWARPPDDDDCQYDAFLSYSHHDSGVADQLVAELEGGARPLRLCLHHRDWRAGDWIPAQIARSVAESRRTVILLSEHFVRSGWARAEFREAHARALRDPARAPRLVVVVLGAAPPTSLDAELRHYVRNNTYVRWGEPAFWEKLRLALPAPRAPPAPAPAAHTPAPAAPTPAPAVPTPAPPFKFPPLPQLRDAPAPATQTSPCA